MGTISFILYIKDLLVFKSPIIHHMCEEYIESSNQKGVSIGDLFINPYVFQSRSLDVPYLLKYIESLDKLAGVFREIYDEYLYSLRIDGYIDNHIHDIISNSDSFNMIFNSINNKFNAYINDQYLFEDFGIYQSSTSVETCMALYEEFNDSFTRSMIDLVDPKRLKFIIMQKSSRYLQNIYYKIFEQFEGIYLPFY